MSNRNYLPGLHEVSIYLTKTNFLCVFILLALFNVTHTLHIIIVIYSEIFALTKMMSFLVTMIPTEYKMRLLLRK